MDTVIRNTPNGQKNIRHMPWRNSSLPYWQIAGVWEYIYGSFVTTEFLKNVLPADQEQ